MSKMKLTNKQHTDYCEILNNFRCKAIDIVDELTKEYKDTLADDIDSKLNNYKTENENLICSLNECQNKIAELQKQLEESEKMNKRLYNENESAEKILRMSSNEQTREILKLQKQLKSQPAEIIKNIKNFCDIKYCDKEVSLKQVKDFLDDILKEYQKEEN